MPEKLAEASGAKVVLNTEIKVVERGKIFYKDKVEDFDTVILATPMTEDQTKIRLYKPTGVRGR